MFSDHVVNIAGRSFIITTHNIWIASLFFLLGLVVAFLISGSRGAIRLKRSSGTNQICFELARIAEALERISSRSVESAMAAAARRANSAPPPERESPGITYSARH